MKKIENAVFSRPPITLFWRPDEHSFALIKAITQFFIPINWYWHYFLGLCFDLLGIFFKEKISNFLGPFFQSSFSKKLGLFNFRHKRPNSFALTNNWCAIAYSLVASVWRHCEVNVRIGADQVLVTTIKKRKLVEALKITSVKNFVGNCDK